MIDFTKPIETQPCETNTDPVPCHVEESHRDGESARIVINGAWVDKDGENMEGRGWVARAADGAFIALNGSVRNVF